MYGGLLIIYASLNAFSLTVVKLARIGAWWLVAGSVSHCMPICLCCMLAPIFMAVLLSHLHDLLLQHDGLKQTMQGALLLCSHC